MSASDPHEICFEGVRVRYDSTKGYDELVAALLADIGERPVPIDDFAKALASWDSYEQEVQSYVGPSGFMSVNPIHHGATKCDGKSIPASSIKFAGILEAVLSRRHPDDLGDRGVG